MADNYVIWFENLRMTDVESVGGKNASLGEMISQLTEKGVRVPGGFATTAEAYRAFLAHNGLSERISAALAQLDVEDVAELARVGKEIRQWILDTPFPEQLDAEIETAWNKMVADAGGADISVAVRSSATAEDLPDASFAGQQETFLNINGLENVKEAMHHVFASCTTTAPSPTASIKASNTTSSPSPQVCNAWCVPTAARPASCSPSTPNPASTKSFS